MDMMRINVTLIIQVMGYMNNMPDIEKEIIELKNNETFEVINSITNWDNYFTATKEQLKEELNNLTLEIQP